MNAHNCTSATISGTHTNIYLKWKRDWNIYSDCPIWASYQPSCHIRCLYLCPVHIKFHSHQVHLSYALHANMLSGLHQILMIFTIYGKEISSNNAFYYILMILLFSGLPNISRRDIAEATKRWSKSFITHIHMREILREGKEGKFRLFDGWKGGREGGRGG